ncbi:MAG: plasma-membrane proton-efflux P-type ATPase [Candidatus Atabeyarchaeum deiterrae]
MKRDIRKLESISAETAFKTLRSSSRGLTSKEAYQRIFSYGYNEVEEKKASRVITFLRRFWGPTAWMLEAVAAMSYFLNQTINMLLVVALLILNAIIGFSQESRSEQAVEILKSRLVAYVKVLRDGKWTVKPTREIVPGDIVSLRNGDIIPADMKLTEGRILVDQSSLTGESIPSDKGAGGVVYAGSIVKRNEAKGLVFSTGSRTYYGKTITLVKMAKAKSHVESLIANVVKYILLVVFVITVCVVVYSIFIELSFPEILSFVLMLLVSSVPIALPAMFTVTMAVGALKLFRSGVLVTRMTAVEDAATMTTVCTDKTGTITENKLSVVEPAPMKGFDRGQVALLAMLASEEASQDPIDVAIIKYARSLGLDGKGYRVTKFTSFDPSTRRTEATAEKSNGDIFRVMKGAPRILLDLAGVDDETKKIYWRKVEELSAGGLRVIAVAVEEQGRTRIAGFVPITDRPRRDSRKLVAELRSLGINVKMLTGDIAPIATAIADEVKIGGQACRTGKVRKGIRKEIDKCDVFAEVYPEDKLTIVKSLQSNGHIVGMTGDGVNDAPALKQAEVGTAVKNATDAARAAASVVLTKEGLSGIVDLVKTGREAFQRMYTWIINKIVKTFQLSVFLSTAFFILGILVTTTPQLILLLFLTDFITISLATDNVTSSRQPDKWEIDKMTKAALAITSVVLVEMFAGLFLALGFFSLGIDQLHTFVFYMLMVTGVTDVFIVRERRRFWNSKPSKTLLAALLLDLCFATILCIFGIQNVLTPIPVQLVIVVLALAALMMLPKDYVKRVALAHEYRRDT